MTNDNFIMNPKRRDNDLADWLDETEKADSNQIVDLPLDYIDDDPKYNGDRKIDPGDRAALADAILRAGRLFSPVVVYKDHEESSGTGIIHDIYHILSGNKRIAAWKLLNAEYTDKGWEKKDSIPCLIIKKPDSDNEIIYQQLVANLGRKSDSDLEQEAAIAKGLWDRYSKEEKAKFNQTLLRVYKESVIPSDTYIKLKEENRMDEYIRQNFRPAAMFVWMLTGESVSYRSTQRILTKINAESVKQDIDVMPDIQEKPKAVKKERKVLLSTVKKSLKEASTNMKKYYDNPDHELSESGLKLMHDIDEFLASMDR